MEENTTEDLIHECREQTKAHIKSVQNNLAVLFLELGRRHKDHDKSKLEEPELSIFARVTPKLKDSTYGSEEYYETLKELGPALEHHYKNNSHHPEHYENGIEGMCLVDVMEMFCDWMAAAERHRDGNVLRSIDIQEDRFGISPQLSQIFRNTLEKYWSSRYDFDWNRYSGRDVHKSQKERHADALSVFDEAVEMLEKAFGETADGKQMIDALRDEVRPKMEAAQ